MENYLPPGYQLIAIDLPYHGKTAWKEEKLFAVQDLIRIIDQVLGVHNLTGASLTLLGFSMGGRMSLGVLQTIPHRIDKMILLAPDGLKVNFWYWLATQTYIGNRLFRFTMKYPGWFFALLSIGRRMRLINRSVYKFTSNYVDDKVARRELYQRWSGLRNINPDLKIIKKKIAQHEVRIELIYGEFDRIIRQQRGARFRKGIEAYCNLHVLKAGHQLLQEKNAALITGLL